MRKMMTMRTTIKGLRGSLSALALASGLLMAMSSTVWAGDFLADRHVARGMTCETCHTADKKLKMVGDNEICVSCHGDYPEMIKKTEGRYEVNPHAQHDGLLPCTECHKGHKASVNYCGDCHNYTYKVP